MIIANGGKKMNKIVEVLRETGIFYIATMDGDQPRVRPFSAVMEFNGKVYICTSNKKEVYKQIVKNPKVEISGTKPSGDWVRVNGTLVKDDNDAARVAMLEEVPPLNNLYHIGDGAFEVLYLDNPVATVYFTSGGSKIITE